MSASAQTEFTERALGKSQTERVLTVLQNAKGEYVAMPELARLSGSLNVHSRIADLRKRGHVIQQLNEREEGVCKSFYRLLDPYKEAL